MHLYSLCLAWLNLLTHLPTWGGGGGLAPPTSFSIDTSVCRSGTGPGQPPPPPPPNAPPVFTSNNIFVVRGIGRKLAC